MTKEREQVELTDEEYEILADKYGKVAVLKIEDEDYVLRYPNKIEFDAIKKTQLKGDINRSLHMVEATVEGLIVWPELDVFKSRTEQDGGLMTLIAAQFMNFYMNRAVMDEKKRA